MKNLNNKYKISCFSKLHLHQNDYDDVKSKAGFYLQDVDVNGFYSAYTPSKTPKNWYYSSASMEVSAFYTI